MSTPAPQERSMIPNLRVLWPRLLVAGVLPVVAYSIIRSHLPSDAIALIVVMVFPLADIAVERMRHGGFEPIGIIALAGIAIGVVAAVVTHGNATLLKLRESVFTGLFGVVCLGSLLAPRPVMFFLGRFFETGGDPELVADFNTRWELPGVPGRFKLVTAVWGVGLAAEAGVRTVLAVTLSTGRFLLVAQLLNWTVLGLLFWWTIAFTKRATAALEALGLLPDALAPAPAPTAAEGTLD